MIPIRGLRAPVTTASLKPFHRCSAGNAGKRVVRHSHWTPNKVEILERMWAAGRSAAAIAEVLGEVSPAAVIGKANRMGLTHGGERGA